MAHSQEAKTLGLHRITIPIKHVNRLHRHPKAGCECFHDIIVVPPATTDKPAFGRSWQMVYPGNDGRHRAIGKRCRPVGYIKLGLNHQPVNPCRHIFAVQ